MRRLDDFRWKIGAQSVHFMRHRTLLAGLGLFLVLSLVVPVKGTATETDAQRVLQQYYLAYYGRPAEPGGLDYWLPRIESAQTEDDRDEIFGIVRASFGTVSQPEFTGIYGENVTNEQFFDRAYQNILNRSEDDQDARDYWLGLLRDWTQAHLQLAGDESVAEALARADVLSLMINAALAEPSSTDYATFSLKIAFSEVITTALRQNPDLPATEVLTWESERLSQVNLYDQALADLEEEFDRQWLPDEGVTPPVLNMASGARSAVVFDWTPNEAASEHRLFFGQSADLHPDVHGSYEGVVPISSIPYTLGSLENGIYYYFVATAIVDGVESQPSNRIKAMPVIPPVQNYPFTAAGNFHSVAVDAQGMAWSWGQGRHAALGVGDNEDRAAPAQIGVNAQWRQISAGERHTLALDDQGYIWAWGDNTWGQLGSIETVGLSLERPVRLDAMGSGWKQVGAGSRHSLAIDKEGQLWAFGENLRGQLGLGHTDAMPEPARVSHDRRWVELSAGHLHSLAIDEDGQLYAWGYNQYGQVGVGESAESRITSPVPINTGDQWVATSAGYENSFAIREDGSLWGWGRNVSGSLGIGEVGVRYQPERVGMATDWQVVAAGGHFACGIRRGGRLWCWGDNRYGNLALGDNMDRDLPHEVEPQLSGWVGVDLGLHHLLAVHSDGGLYAAGYNYYGQIGAGEEMKDESFRIFHHVMPEIDWLK